MKRDKPNKNPISLKCHSCLQPIPSNIIPSDEHCIPDIIDAHSKYHSIDIYNNPLFDFNLRSNQHKIANGLKTVETILISIYNHHISIQKKEPLDIPLYCKQVYELSHGFDDDCYLELMYILLKKMKELIGRYKDKIFLMKNIPKLRDLNVLLQRRKSLSMDHCIPFRFKLLYRIRANIRRNSTIDTTTEKKNKDKMRIETRSVFFELRNIKRTLIKSSKDIEEIFIEPKKTFNRFSIEQCQREEFVNTLVNDTLVKHLLKTSIDEEFIDAIREIEEDKDKNLSQMSDFLYFLNQDDNINIDSLSLDYIPNIIPVKAKNTNNKIQKENHMETNLNIDELVKFIDGNDNTKKKPKKKKKKNQKKIYLDKVNTNANASANTNTNANVRARANGNNNNGVGSNATIINNPIQDNGFNNELIVDACIGDSQMFSINSESASKIQKIKTSFSEAWLNNIKTSIY